MVQSVTFSQDTPSRDEQNQSVEHAGTVVIPPLGASISSGDVEMNDVKLIDTEPNTPSENGDDKLGLPRRSASYSHLRNLDVRKSALPMNRSSDNLFLTGERARYSLRRGSHASTTTSMHSAGRRPRSVHSMRETAPIVREKKDLHDMNKERDFFTKSVAEVAIQLGVDIKTGLKPEDIRIRKDVFGDNLLKREKGISAVRLFLGHLIGVLNFILLAAAIASVVTSVLQNSYDYIEGIFILGIIVMNTSIGFIQEYRSAKTMQSLMKMFAPEADVFRDGQRLSIPAKNLVPGDIVFLEDGDFVPADLRLMEAVHLSIDEAFLTGETDPVTKTTGALKAEEAKALGDRSNIAYMSSVVTSGRGKGMVVRTGEDTEIGEIAKKLRNSSKDKKKTELQKSMKTLGLTLFLCGLVFSCVVLAIQVLALGTDAFSERGTWLYLVALCVAVIPEGLPCVLALTLALGMRNMAKKNAIVRKLGVLESLNWITDICSDKTGTLTEGKMVATAIFCEEKQFRVTGTGIIPEGNITDRSGAPVPLSSLSEDRALTHFLRACSLCNMATLTQVNDEWQATSSPTEIALQVLAHKVGMGKPTLEAHYQFMGEHPFDSHWKRMSVVYKKSDSPIEEVDDVPPELTVLFMKGSVEAVLNCCIKIYTDVGVIDLTDAKRKKIIEQVEKLASQGLRVLACAMKENFKFSTTQNRQSTDEKCTFLGLAGIMDPPRAQSKPAVQKARQAGINVYMLTGDHKKTAANIAKQVGIISSDLHDRVMIGSEFEAQKVIGDDFPKVIARCNPDTKIKMIDELHARGRFVVMTGDGVNDAPAIKRSDVGVAMGIGGSEVTKNSADIVLMDDNFGTIIVAIEEGRRIYSNIYKIVSFLMVNNVGELMVLVLGLCFTFIEKTTPQWNKVVMYPLTPMQILWINVIVDTPVCMALGMEPVNEDVMRQKPKTKKDALFNVEMNVDILFYGFVVGVLSLANFAIAYFTVENRAAKTVFFGTSVQTALYTARAVCFTTITYCLLFHSFNTLHPRNSILLHRFEKKWIIFTVAFGALSMLFTIYVPFVNTIIFKHYILDWQHWVQICTAVGVFAVVSELYKLIKKGFISFYRNGRYALSLAERVARAMDNIDAKLGERGNPEEEEL